jgi:type II secretory ATPase GspE/PulE/Tfp pilus assembly ATPase PilB-like protein
MTNEQGFIEIEEMEDPTFDSQTINRLDLEQSLREPPIRKLAKLIIYDAAQKDASHVYIEKDGVKYEIDGSVSTQINPPKRLHTAVGEELKYIFGLMEEREIPLTFWQRFRGIVPKTKLVCKKDFPNGQIANTRMRYMRQDQNLGDVNLNFSTTRLGETEAYHIELFEKFPRLHWKGLEEFILQPGLYIISSPINQGKTTTAYYMFAEDVSSTVRVSLEEKMSYPLGDNTRILITPEDPEYEQTLRGIRSYQPRVLLFDDVRENRTLKEALYHASIGAKVFIVVPAKDIPMSLTYLERLGVSRRQIVENLKGAFSQRLVRKLNSEEYRERQPYKGLLLVSQRLEASKIEKYRSEIIEGDFSKLALPSFSKWVEKLVTDKITNEAEIYRAGYD